MMTVNYYEQVKQAHNAYRKGIITYGEYVSVQGEALIGLEQELFDADNTVVFHENTRFIELLNDIKALNR